MYVESGEERGSGETSEKNLERKKCSIMSVKVKEREVTVKGREGGRRGEFALGGRRRVRDTEREGGRER